MGRVPGAAWAASHWSAHALLGADDRDDLGIDVDGIGRAVDLGLLVAEPGGERIRVVRRGAAGEEREQRVAVQQADLVDPPAQPCLQHHDPHGLLVAEPVLPGGGAEHLDLGHDPGHGLVADHVGARVGQPWPGKLAAAEEHGVLRSEQQPVRVAQRGCRGVLVVVHEAVELLDRAGGLQDVGRGDRLAGRRAALGARRLEVPEELQHQHPQLRGIAGYPGAVRFAPGQERVEHRRAVQPVVQ